MVVEIFHRVSFMVSGCFSIATQCYHTVLLSAHLFLSKTACRIVIKPGCGDRRTSLRSGLCADDYTAALHQGHSRHSGGSFVLAQLCKSGCRATQQARSRGAVCAVTTIAFSALFLRNYLFIASVAHRDGFLSSAA